MKNAMSSTMVVASVSNTCAGLLNDDEFKWSGCYACEDFVYFGWHFLSSFGVTELFFGLSLINLISPEFFWGGCVNGRLVLINILDSKDI